MPLKEITQKIDLFLAAQPSDSLGACREQWAAFVWAYAEDYHIQQQQELERLSVKTAKGIEFIPIAHILYLQSDKGYTTFFLEGGEKILVSKVLKSMRSYCPVPNLYVLTSPIWSITAISVSTTRRVYWN